MKKSALAIILCCAFSVHVTAIDTNDNYRESYVLRTLIENDSKDIEELIRNSCTEADKATLKAAEAHFKARVKDVQSYKVYVTKADVLKMCSIEADKSRVEDHEAYIKFREARSALDSTSSTSKFEELSALLELASANASKMRAILLETQVETTKSNSNEAVRLYNRAAKFYDKAVKSYGEIVTACSSTNPAIIRAAEKVKSPKEYAKYKAYVAEKRKAAEFWTKYQTHVKKLKEVSDAYARVAAIRIELHKAVKTYAKAAKTYAKAAKTYVKVAKSSITLPEADRLCCFKFEDAAELHKAHKISDAQLASVTVTKASNDTLDAYAAYCRTNSKLMEAIVAACCVEDEVVKLKTELYKSSVEQAQDIVQRQAEGLICY
jgi:hypothetical protein